MFELSTELQERLDKLPLLDFLVYMHDRIESIRHRAKSDTAYNEGRTLARHVKVRIVKEYHLTWEDFDNNIGKNLRQSEEILDLYSFKESDKRKESRIKEFVDEYTYDLSNKINAIKRSKESGSPTAED